MCKQTTWQKLKALVNRDEEKKYLCDQNGQPIIWYRGMYKSDYKNGCISNVSNGIFFCDSESVARSYANDDFVLRAYITVANPFIVDANNNGYEHIPFNCKMSSPEEVSRFMEELIEKYPTERVFSTDQIGRFIRNNTSHDSVIIRNVYEEGILNNSPVTDICIWNNACIEILK